MTDSHIDPSIRAEILEQLRVIESVESVRILYACESGSRAWGFASRDSDYDVRFLYVHPQDWYLSIADPRDVIERPISGVLDISGWELKKALRLFRKSNPPLLEWLGSPIVYRESGQTAAKMRDLAARQYSPVACSYHYLHMARGNCREYLEAEEVWTKKYLYVLRPLLAIQWIERGLGVVPTAFQVLVDELVPNGALRVAIDQLLDRKRSGRELGKGPPIPEIDTFIDRELERHTEGWNLGPKQPIDIGSLDAIFREALQEGAAESDV